MQEAVEPGTGKEAALKSGQGTACELLVKCFY